ncbi:MAG: glycosyltransferase family 25 protein [Hyphomicrobiaceae bacterium]
MPVAAFVINLAADKARMLSFAAQADACALPVRRVEAVRGFAMPDWLAPLFLDASGAPRSPLLPGEVGCYASHLIAAAHIVRDGLPMAVVFEDDVEFDSDLPALLETLVASLPVDWDIVRLSSPTRRSVLSLARLSGRHHLVRYSKLPKASGAYLLSASGARKLLAATPRVRPFDADLRYGWLLGLDSYGVYPEPVRQPERFASTIKPAAVARRAARGRRWKRPHAWARVVGVAHMVRALGFQSWLACSWQNASLALDGKPSRATAAPVAAHHHRAVPVVAVS